MDYHCNNCSLLFNSPAQLLNHQRRFCTNSGFDTMEGLVKKDVNRNIKSNLKQYGKSSLGALKYQPDDNVLYQDIKNIKQYQQKVASHNHYYHQSQVTQNLSQITQSDRSFISPPTFPPQKHNNLDSVLHKSNSSIQRMSMEQKKQYAQSKLNQLNKIKQLYQANDGNNTQFKKNVEKMIEFYKNMIQQCQPTRLSTPISKLQQFNETHHPYYKQKGTLKTSKKQQHHQPINNQQPINQQPYNQQSYNQLTRSFFQNNFRQNNNKCQIKCNLQLLNEYQIIYVNLYMLMH